MSYPATARTTPTRSAERARYDADTVHAVLDQALVCHVGFVVDGRPVVLPQLHVRVGSTLYLHGSTGARSLRLAAGGGLPVCVTVTLLDALVLARSAFHHSVNYRSVVAHGDAHPVTDPAERETAFRALVEHLVPGRWADVRPPSRKEHAATALLRLDLVEVSAKVRDAGVKDDPEDLALPHWAGLLPLALTPGGPVHDPDLPSGTPVPAHVSGWTGAR